jgi:hypothetical protein
MARASISLARSLRAIARSNRKAKSRSFIDAMATATVLGSRMEGFQWPLAPDLQVFAAARGITSKSNDEIRDAMGNEASLPMYRSIICLGRLIAHFESNRWIIDSVYAWHIAAQSEKEIIKDFFDTIADVKPRLVTFDGSTILLYHAMRHKLATLSYSTQPSNPYVIDDMSLCDVLSPSSQ